MGTMSGLKAAIKTVTDESGPHGPMMFFFIFFKSEEVGPCQALQVLVFFYFILVLTLVLGISGLDSARFLSCFMNIFFVAFSACFTALVL